VERLTVASAHGDYEVVAEPGAAARLREIVVAAGLKAPRSVVSDITVGPFWGRPAASSLAAPLIELPDGEPGKRWPTVEVLLGRWLELGLHRGDGAAAVGGGVLSDTVGFAAAVYLRGIDWLAVPTTLLAMVDASVGGKTGVNLEQGKNLVGAFWPPRLVVVDVATLATLPERELRAGAAEIVKTAWIGDRELLEILPAGGLESFQALAPDQWQTLVMRCLAVKAKIVGVDERENKERAALNLGHTLGHALEAATSYRRFLHGEAVAWGLLAAARLGRRRGVLSVDGEQALTSAVGALGTLPPISDIEAGAVAAHLGRDKKRSDSGINWVLPSDDGVVLGQPVPAAEALEVFEELKRIPM
jgi:3-dehydroquinate synthase